MRLPPWSVLKGSTNLPPKGSLWDGLRFLQPFHFWTWSDKNMVVESKYKDSFRVIYFVRKHTLPCRSFSPIVPDLYKPNWLSVSMVICCLVGVIRSSPPARIICPGWTKRGLAPYQLATRPLCAAATLVILPVRITWWYPSHRVTWQ